MNEPIKTAKLSYEVNKLGYPVDKELRRLEFSLCDLAAEFRASNAHTLNARSIKDILQEYPTNMGQLYSCGKSLI